ncbi:hypothetical protein CNY89_27425, partial [Amaricoccus sp. HAR-UPW-R2A-40]
MPDRPFEAALNNLSNRVAAYGDFEKGGEDRRRGFGLWGPQDGDAWLDAYVTDFLGRARGLGRTVPDRPFEAALNNLSNRVAAYGDFEKGGED